MIDGGFSARFFVERRYIIAVFTHFDHPCAIPLKLQEHFLVKFVITKKKTLSAK